MASNKINFPTTATEVACDFHLYVFNKSKSPTFEEAYLSGQFTKSMEHIDSLNYTECRSSVWEVQDLINTLLRAFGSNDLKAGILLENEDTKAFVPIDALGSLLCTYGTNLDDGLDFNSVYDFCYLAAENPEFVKEKTGDDNLGTEIFKAINSLDDEV